VNKKQNDFHTAALRVIERIDSDVTPEHIAAEAAAIKAENLERMRIESRGPVRNRQPAIRECKTTMLPVGHGKVKPR